MEILAKHFYDMVKITPPEIPGVEVEDWVNGGVVESEPYKMSNLESATLRLALLVNGEDPRNNARVLEIWENATDPARQKLQEIDDDCIENFAPDGTPLEGRVVDEGIRVYLKHGPKESVIVRKWVGRDVRRFTEMNQVEQSMNVLAMTMRITLPSLLQLHIADFTQCFEAQSFLMASGSDSVEIPG